MDHLQVMGQVVVHEEGSLIILETLNVAASGTVLVKNKLKYSELKQNGKLIYHSKD